MTTTTQTNEKTYPDLYKGIPMKKLEFKEGNHYYRADNPSEWTFSIEEDFIQVTVEAFSDLTKLVNMNIEGKYRTVTDKAIIRIQKPIESSKELRMVTTALDTVKYFARVSDLTVIYNANGLYRKETELLDESVEYSISGILLEQKESGMKAVVWENAVNKDYCLHGAKHIIVKSIYNQTCIDEVVEFIDRQIANPKNSQEDLYTVFIKFYSEGFGTRDMANKPLQKLFHKVKKHYRNTVLMPMDCTQKVAQYNYVLVEQE